MSSMGGFIQISSLGLPDVDALDWMLYPRMYALGCRIVKGGASFRALRLAKSRRQRSLHWGISVVVQS